MDTTKLIIDLTIGDGWIGYPSGNRGNPRPIMRIEHSIKQLDYARHKEDLLANAGFRLRCKRYTSTTKKNHGREYYRIDVLADDRLVEPHKLLYAPKKQLKHIIDYIDAQTLAYWYMDDGHTHNIKYALKKYAKLYYDPPYIGSFTIACHSFSLADMLLVQNKLKQFGIDTTLQKGITLSINTIESKLIFRDMVRPFIVPSMYYKFQYVLKAADTTIVKRESR